MKKLLFFSLFLHIGLMYAQFDSRVFEVMYQGPGGIEQVNNRILFAETKNIAFDLNLLEISSRFGCLTKMGKEFLARYLARMVSPKDTNSTIKNRQNLIKFLVEHPELRLKFEKLIEEALEHEHVAMKFIQKRFVLDPNGNPIKYVMHLMKSNWAYQTYDQAGSALNLLGSKKRIEDRFSNVGVKWNESEKAFQALLAGASLLSLGSYLYSSGDLSYSLQEAVWAPWGTIMGVYGLYTHYTEALEIRDSLHALNRLIAIAQEIEDMCEKYKVDHQFKLSSIRSEDGRKLLRDLQHDRYSNKDSYFILTPLVHTFIYQVYEHDSHLAPMYASIAEIDAYVAIAKKIASLQDADHKICFAEFLDNKKPIVHAKDFWNMLVSKGNVVVNDIFEDRNVILTGSNEGGKTTAIRAILQNIVLAQTFGIAAASEFKVTQFDVINSFLNVSDDILNGKSRFASELKQAQDILNRIKALKSDEKFFFAFDELFTGTNGEDGAECAYRFIDNVASYSGIQFIYATHFNRLKTIGSSNKACVNYKIEPPLRDEKGVFIRDDKGQLVYPYKLSLGANDINVAMDRAKDAGIFA